MISNVTAILVVKNGGPFLATTLDALEAQTVQPGRLLVISLGESKNLMSEIKGRDISKVVVAKSKASFGEALKFGVSALGPIPNSEASSANHIEWLWMLTEDSAPDPDALEKLMREISRTGSATVAGPKLVDWDDPQQIIELGQSLTWAGSRWALDNQELDQQQYDHLEDVLGVGPVGMIVRRDIWEHLQGFDPALKVYDDGLDFSVRARLAGFRVIVVPEARIRFARTGVSGPEWGRKAALINKAHREARTSQLHRRLTYAKAPLVPLLWLLLPLIGVFGVIWALVRGRPGTIIGEMRAALTVFFSPGKIRRSRRTLKAVKNSPWSALKPLRTDRKTVRSVRAIRKETILAELGRSRRDLNFIAQGGLGLTLAMSVLAIALTWWLLGASFLNGGGTAPLSGVSELWSNTLGVYPANLADFLTAAGAESSIPADPINWLFAVFGTLTFWNPSFAVVLLFILAVPLASLGGWMWGARLSQRTSARILSGVVWGVGPMLLAAMATGRVNSVILAVLLPWVLVAVSNAHVSWGHAATASLLTAAALAVAPSLIPAATIMLAVALIAKPKKIPQTLLISLAPAVLFSPIAVRAWFSGRPFESLIDPGMANPYTPGTPWQMLLGFPTFGLDGWGEILYNLGVPAGSLTLTVGVLLTPLALLAVIGLFMGHPRVTSLVALAGALGLTTALASPYLQLTPHISKMVPVWAGSGLALYWAAVITLAVLGVPLLRRAAAPAVAIAIIGVMIVVSPSLVRLTTNQVDVQPGVEQLPAVALAKAKTDPLVRTLFITPTGAETLRTEVVEGTSKTLDQMRTAEVNQPITELEEKVAEIIGQLASGASDQFTETESNVISNLSEARIHFIVMRQPTGAGGLGLYSQLQAVFDGRTELEAVGETAKGMLWRTSAEPTATASSDTTAGSFETSESADSFSNAQGAEKTIWITQLALLLAILLLALPTAEVRLRPARAKKLKRRETKTSEVVVSQTTATGFTSQSTSAAAESEITESEITDSEIAASETELTNSKTPTQVSDPQADQRGADDEK